MSLRESYPRAQFSRSHYFISVSRGEAFRTITIRPFVLWAIGSLLPLAALWAGGASLYIAFHDDMLGVYVARQAEMQNAYEDRIAEARAEVDRVASRQLLDQNSFEGKMHDLLSRQARLEQHGSIVSALAGEAARDPLVAAEARALGKTPAGALGAIEALGRSSPSDSVIAPTVRAFAPAPPALAPPALAKPRPVEDTHENLSAIPRTEGDRAAADLAAAADNPDLDASARLGLISYSLDRVERGQIADLGEIAKVASDAASRLGGIVARAGLSAEELKAPEGGGGMGGPFIPAAVDPSAPAFDQAAARAEREVEAADRLRRLMPFLPVREPLYGQVSVSSPFGYRPDPFIGRLALHPGIDLVQAYGSEIRATAAGRVVHAGPMGGYGNMVEVDHGNGLATRYGHMSEVLVSEGEEVRAGAVLGRIGSTGRSTGPHLHYEVRVDGEPVDPDRFLKAGAGMFAEQ
jgi:murein DD-endopeptidase MepM/ murein hydrolase activator NlpD